MADKLFVSIATLFRPCCSNFKAKAQAERSFNYVRVFAGLRPAWPDGCPEVRSKPIRAEKRGKKSAGKGYSVSSCGRLRGYVGKYRASSLKNKTAAGKRRNIFSSAPATAYPLAVRPAASSPPPPTPPAPRPAWRFLGRRSQCF